MKILFLDMDGVINTAGKDKYSLSLVLPYDFENNKDFFILTQEYFLIL